MANNYVAKFGYGYNFVAVFKVLFRVTIEFDNTLGTARYTRDSSDGNYLSLVATPNSNAQFLGWYINSSKISSSESTNYTLLSDTVIEARFERIYDVNTSVEGNGAITYSRGTDPNEITFNVIAETRNHFVKYTVNEREYFNTPLTVRITSDVDVVAYFEEDRRIHITASTNIKYASVHISHNDDYADYTSVLWARPFPDYQFTGWQDGNTDNPRSITVTGTSDLTFVAKYQRLSDTNGIYQYRCFVKDQLDLAATPKAFMVVDTFSIKRDLMTNANSTITVMEMPTNVDEGDVIVLYDPKGTTLYQGVIKSIDVNKITCSQMASYYKGTWIYNVSPQDYLEHELSVLLQDYASGHIYKSSYVDPLVAQRLGGITIDYVGTTSVHLPTDLDDEGNEQMTKKDMEQFIYEIYDKYGIEFEFEINLSGTNYCHIRVPSFETIKVGNNMFAIKDMSPITEIEETNRLIIYAQDKTYRTTYVATKNNIVEAPQSTANRFNITNTTVVFSDDPVADLVASNLPQTMFNHRLTFSLIIKNFIYEFGDFNLGGTLDIYFNDDYYNSVLTGYEIEKASNRNITEAKFICGKVRVKLTQMLTLGKV